VDPAKNTHSRKYSTTSRVRDRILAGGERLWTYQNFADFPVAATAKALSRLTKEGLLERESKGVYYRSRQTVLGKSRPSITRVAELSVKHTLHPSGVSAANLLGFTTQNPAHPQFATTGTNRPTKLSGSKLYTRRPLERDKLSSHGGALLEFLRSRGKLSELSPDETIKILLQELRNQEQFMRIAEAAKAEPPRVRAMLGAIGEEAGLPGALTAPLRESLNKLSRFEFGILRSLKYAKEWHAK
jgi:hypothetical protein